MRSGRRRRRSVSALRWTGPALIVLGAVLVAAAVATGAAHLDLVVIIPVFVGGASALFVGGVLALFLGVMLLPLAFGAEWARPEESLTGPRVPSSSVGGVVLIGPFPIFLGAWRHPRRRTFWLAVSVGAALVLAAIVLALVLR